MTNQTNLSGTTWQTSALFHSLLRRIANNISKHTISVIIKAIIVCVILVTAFLLSPFRNGEMSFTASNMNMAINVILCIACWIASTIVYETLYRTNDYILLTRLPVKASPLYFYVLIYILFRILLVIFFVVYIDLLLALNLQAIVIHIRSILTLTAICLFLCLLAGYGNTSGVLNIFRRLLSSSLIPEIAFLYYAPGFSVAIAIIPEMRWGSGSGIDSVLTLYSLGVFVSLLLFSYFLYIGRFLSIRVYTEDAWLQYNIKAKLTEEGKIFGQFWERILPDRLAAVYLLLLRIIRRKHAPAYYLYPWAIVLLLFTWWIFEKEIFIPFSFSLSVIFILFNMFYLQRSAWLPRAIFLGHSPVRKRDLLISKALISGWLHFFISIFFALVLLLNPEYRYYGIFLVICSPILSFLLVLIPELLTNRKSV